MGFSTKISFKMPSDHLISKLTAFFVILLWWRPLVNADVLDSFDTKAPTEETKGPEPQNEEQNNKKKSSSAASPEEKQREAVKSKKTSSVPTATSPHQTKAKQETKPHKEKASSQEANKNAMLPINLSSDGVSALKEVGTIELEKNVLITQGDLSLKSNSAKVFYKDEANEVEKIIAEGNVQVDKFDEVTQKPMHASGKKITFINDRQIIILEGNAKISRGKDNMRGNIISYDLNTGEIKAEKIETIVYPEENQIKKP